MVVNVTKIFWKIEKRNWLNTEKNIIEWGKKLHYNYKEEL